MLDFLKKLFGLAPAQPAPEAPYKVEAPQPVAQPEPAKCGCGRSPTGFCVGLHKLSNEEWAKHPDNKTAPPVPTPAPKPKAEKKPKAPAKPKAKKASK